MEYLSGTLPDFTIGGTGVEWTSLNRPRLRCESAGPLCQGPGDISEGRHVRRCCYVPGFQKVLSKVI